MTASRFLAAILAAGATNLVLGFSFAHLVGIEQIQGVLRQHGLRVIGEPSDAVPHLIVRLLFGVGVTALYTFLVPRFGAGPRAALVAGLFAWVFVYCYTAWGHAHIGLFPPRLSWALAGWGLVEMTLTALAGGWVAAGRRFWS